jgi:hypothetical protein
VNLAAIQAGQIEKLLSSATQNIDKGFRFQDQGKDYVRDQEGNIVFITVPGSDVQVPLTSEWSTEVSLNSYVDLANSVEGLQLKVGTITEAAGINQKYSAIPQRDGLDLSITKSGGSTTNSEAIAALLAGYVKDKEASGEATRKAIEAEWNGKVALVGKSVEVLDVLGNVTVGILESLDPALRIARVAGKAIMAREIAEVPSEE